MVDEADLLLPDVEARLSDRLEGLEDNTGRQFVVATVLSLQGRPIEDYSICLANKWGIGRSVENDGVVFLVAPKERQVRIEVGYGLEADLTDNEARSILDNDVLPAFREGRMVEGIEVGVAAIIREVAFER